MKTERQMQYGSIRVLDPEEALGNAGYKAKARSKLMEMVEAYAHGGGYFRNLNYAKRQSALIKMGMAEVGGLDLNAYFFETCIGNRYPQSSIYIAHSCVKPCAVEAEAAAEELKREGVQDWRLQNGLWVPSQEFVVLGAVPEFGERLFRMVLEEIVK